ncbi:hypothetical protein B0H11DRAFT_2231797 [Mycena galericulata]|nr:hypothetical protein B0H11DRAFT_2231797 [Mycena galericulata]
MPSSDDRENPRRIVDVEPDDDDSDWQDELPGLGASTHRSRNRGKGVIPLRKRKRNAGGANVRADKTRRRGKGSSNIQDLLVDLDAWEAEREERAVELAEKHGVKLKEVRRRMMALSTFKKSRKPSLYNAKITAIMARLNEGRDVGERYLMPEVKKMAVADLSLLEDFSVEEEKKMLKNILANRKLKHHGVRANNLAAAADARRTIANLIHKITALAERAGMVGFAMFSRGHVHDTTVPVTIESLGALNFFREVLKKDPVDVSSLFELWAVQRERGNNTGADTLLGMQKECTEMIKTGLITAAGKTKISMNYESYIKVLVEGQNLGLLGWPKGVEFKRMSKQSAIGPLRTLRDALKSGDCQWKVLTAGEKSRLVAQFKEMVERGEATEKVRKTKTPSRQGATREKSKRAAAAKKAARDEPSEEEEEEESDEEELSAGKGGRGAAVQKKLLALVKAKKAEVKASSKRKAPSGDGERQKRKRTDDDERGAKRKKSAPSTGDDEHRRKRKEVATSSGKRRRTAEDEDEDGHRPAKKRQAPANSTSKSASKSKSIPAKAPAVERPRPRRVYKKAATPPSTSSAAPAQPTAAQTATAATQTAAASQTRHRRRLADSHPDHHWRCLHRRADHCLADRPRLYLQHIRSMICSIFCSMGHFAKSPLIGMGTPRYFHSGMQRWLDRGFRSDMEYDLDATPQEKLAVEAHLANRVAFAAKLFNQLHEMHV